MHYKAKRTLKQIFSFDSAMKSEFISFLLCRSTLEQREYEAMLHVKESIQIAETALMEKDQAQIKEQQLDNEIARLKGVVDAIVKEAGEKTSKEVLAVREECNKSIDKMATEVQQLEEVSISAYSGYP